MAGNDVILAAADYIGRCAAFFRQDGEVLFLQEASLLLREANSERCCVSIG